MHVHRLLNPQLLLKSINTYPKSINLHEYLSLITYVNELKVDDDNTIYFLRQKVKKKYTMLMNGNSSAKKEKMEMYSIPERPELIKKTRSL